MNAAHDIQCDGVAAQDATSLRADLLSKQHALIGLAGSLVTRRLVNIFDATPALKRLRITVDYRWDSADGSPVRAFDVTVNSTFTARVHDQPLQSTALDGPLWLAECATVDDAEIDFNLALEASALLRSLGADLDVGRSESQIDISRRVIEQHRDRKTGKTDLAALGRQVLAF